MYDYELLRMNRDCSRRDFIVRTLAASSALTIPKVKVLADAQSPAAVPPIVVFSKVYQELKLSFEEAAAITAEAGLDGIDCPLRPAGEILPERAKDELPHYIEVLRRQNLQLPLLTTAITGVASPHAE